MKKRVLFVIPSFKIGGTISSLAAFLPAIKENYDISIYSRSSLGDCRELFDDYHIIKENVWLSNTVRSRGRLVLLLSRIIQLMLKCFSCLGINILPLLVKKGCKKIRVDSFDLIVSYRESIAYFVRYFKGRKVCWIHSDVRRSDYGRSFDAFDNIICVSNFAKDCFVSKYPQLAKKTAVVYNFVNEKEIISKSCDESNIDICFNSSKFTVISVGRFDSVKQFDKIPLIAYKLKQLMGCSFIWYVVGASHNFANNLEDMQFNIKKLGLEDDVILLPEKVNIYPYIKKSDVLVVTSKSETFSLVAFEAWTLGTPVIINDIPVAHEIIRGNNGIISTIDEMHNAIFYLYNHPYRVQSFERLSSLTLSNFERIVG